MQEATAKQLVEDVDDATEVTAPVVYLTEEDFARKEADGRIVKNDDPRVEYFGDGPKPNYNDDYTMGVRETVNEIVDKSRVIEVERIGMSKLPKRTGYRFVKRVFDIVSCSLALVICAIPMAAIAVKVKRDSPGPVFYKQERFGWSIIGQKSGAGSANALWPVLSALEVRDVRNSRHRLGVAA